MARERWGSKLGIILAVAGSAVGLGNFLRFPGMAAANGGGAFLIPYFVAVLLLGIPLMWVEWTIGRFGGGFGHSTAPGAFHNMGKKRRFIKYFGVIGIFGPLVILMYYTYVESWLLGYSVFSLTGKFEGCDTTEAVQSFLNSYRGQEKSQYFSNIGPAYGFFLATFAVNILIIWGGIRGGIERFCKWAMPILLVLAVVLLVRVVTLPPQPTVVDDVANNAVAAMCDEESLVAFEPAAENVLAWNDAVANLQVSLAAGDIDALWSQQEAMQERLDAMTVDDLRPIEEGPWTSDPELSDDERTQAQAAAEADAFASAKASLQAGVDDLVKPTVNNGFGFLWNPDWRELKNFKIWLAAAGQVFFTLSIGIGAILTYASYLRKKDDVALSGLTASATNEFAEVILGGSIVIPLAFVFFGASATAAFAKAGTFDLGFLAMPRVLMQMPAGNIFGFLWFLLLFLAGVTSTISLAQPALAFLEDEFNLTRREAALIFGVATFILCHIAIFACGQGAIGELDFWGGTVCLVVFALVEAVMFAWVFGIDKAWTELHVGSDIKIPRIYRFIIKYITPVILVAILVGWMWQSGVKTILLKEVDPPTNVPVIIMIRLLLVLLFAVLCFLVWAVWRRRNAELENEVVE